MANEQEITGGQAGCLSILVLIGIGWVWGYPYYEKNQVIQQFESNHYQIRYVDRVSKGSDGTWGKSELVILLDNGSIVKESQFTDESGSLTRAGDTLDVVYGKDGNVEGARRTKPTTPNPGTQ